METENNDKLIVPTIDEPLKIASTEAFEAWGQTGIGGRKENQDNYGGLLKDDTLVVTVCDGMGGMKGGRTASHLAVSEIIKAIGATKPEDMGPNALKTAIEKANTAIYNCALAERTLRGMGTTATLLVLTPQAAYLTHVGDSRIYLLRKGKKEFRTFDHSKVMEMVAEGLIDEEQARTSSFSNIITRALGVRPDVECEVETLPYKAGDRFVLCCDGVWNAKAEPEMIAIFNGESSTEAAVRHITESVNVIGAKNGGEHDNLTVIVADMKRSSDFQYSIARKIGRSLSRRKSCFASWCRNRKKSK